MGFPTPEAAALDTFGPGARAVHTVVTGPFAATMVVDDSATPPFADACLTQRLGDGWAFVSSTDVGGTSWSATAHGRAGTWLLSVHVPRDVTAVVVRYGDEHVVPIVARFGLYVARDDPRAKEPRIVRYTTADGATHAGAPPWPGDY
jgi:hypothetical protein